jgi:putative MATE family efflux protein
MLQSLITGLVSLVDNFMVADLGDIKMAAVNAANQVNFVFFIIVNTACMAGGIYLSQHRGADNREGMRQAFRFKVLASLLLSGIYFALCMTMPEFLIGIMVSRNSAGPEIIVQGAIYMRSVAPSFIPFALAVAFGSSFREIGQTKVALAASTSAALVNTFLNWVFIYGNLGAPRMEVAGAALATDIARCVEISLFLFWIARRKPGFAFPLRKLFRMDPAMLAEILSRSGMMLFSETAWVVSETIITAMYNSRGGADTVAGMAAAWTMANLFFLVFGAVHTATAVIVGSTLGAGRLEEARRKGRWIMSGSLIFGIAIGALAASSTAVIPIVFANLSLSARTMTGSMVLVIACYLPLWTMLNAQFALSRAGGDTAMGVWVDVGVTYFIFIPIAWAFSVLTPIGPVALYGLSKLTDILKIGVAAWWLKKGRWVRNLASPGKPEGKETESGEA